MDGYSAGWSGIEENRHRMILYHEKQQGFNNILKNIVNRTKIC